MVDVFREIVSRQERGEELVVVTVVATSGSSPSRVGAKMVVPASGAPLGTVGGGALEEEAVRNARDLIRSRGTLLREYVFGEAVQEHRTSGKSRQSKDPRRSGGDAIELPMLCGGGATLFYEYLGAATAALLFGAGHVGRAVACAMAPLGFRITLMDTRADVLASADPPARHPGVATVLLEDYRGALDGVPVPEGAVCLVATHSHDEDYHVLKHLVTGPYRPAYIGVIASRKKSAGFRGRLTTEGVKELPEELLFMPAGLNIGGPSPAEIAVSVLAEVQALRYGRSGHAHMRDG